MNLHEIQPPGLRIGARVRLPKEYWDNRAGTGTIIDQLTPFPRRDQFWVVRPDHEVHNSVGGNLYATDTDLELIG